MYRQRRLVETGLPSDAFSTADEPLPPEEETRRQLAAALAAECRTTEQLVALVA